MDNFTVYDGDKKIDCKILNYFTENNNNYIIYTDYTYDKNGCAKIYASKYIVNENNISLSPIENDEEWEIVNRKWMSINNE